MKDRIVLLDGGLASVTPLQTEDNSEKEDVSSYCAPCVANLIQEGQRLGCEAMSEALASCLKEVNRKVDEPKNPSVCFPLVRSLLQCVVPRLVQQQALKESKDQQIEIRESTSSGDSSLSEKDSAITETQANALLQGDASTLDDMLDMPLTASLPCTSFKRLYDHCLSTLSDPSTTPTCDKIYQSWQRCQSQWLYSEAWRVGSESLGPVLGVTAMVGCSNAALPLLDCLTQNRISDHDNKNCLTEENIQPLNQCLSATRNETLPEAPLYTSLWLTCQSHLKQVEECVTKQWQNGEKALESCLQGPAAQLARCVVRRSIESHVWRSTLPFEPPEKAETESLASVETLIPAASDDDVPSIVQLDEPETLPIRPRQATSPEDFDIDCVECSLARKLLESKCRKEAQYFLYCAEQEKEHKDANDTKEPLPCTKEALSLFQCLQEKEPDMAAALNSMAKETK